MCLCMYACVSTCSYEYTYTRMGVHACKSQKSTLGAFSQWSSTLSFDAVSPIALCGYTSWPASLSDPLSASLALWLLVYIPTASVVMWVLGIQLRSLCLPGKLFTGWAIAPALVTACFMTEEHFLVNRYSFKAKQSPFFSPSCGLSIGLLFQLLLSLSP